MKKNEINYKERELDILKKLNNGAAREEIYAEYGYVSWRSLDGFMRRKGYVFQNGTYQKPEKMREEMLENIKGGTSCKASLIADIFEEKRETADPIRIAEEFGFSDCREMNRYMKENVLQYKSESQKYERVLQENQRTDKVKEESDVEKGEQSVNQIEQSQNIMLTEMPEQRDMKQYMPLLDFLLKHQEQLMKLMNTSSIEQIPHYLVPGIPKVKSIYISDLLTQILDDFARSKNVTIKQICEGAVIQFLSKYGYETEIQMLLKRNV